MPMPLSEISKRRVVRWASNSGGSSARVTAPAGENLMALPTRFTRIWRRRVSSPSTAQGVGWVMNESVTACSCARPWSIVQTSEAMTAGSSGCDSSVILWAPILDASSRSLMIVSRWAALRRMVWTCPGSIVVESLRMSAKPMIAARGVRSSCEMSAMNSSRVRVARSARDRARRRSSTTRTCSVMSTWVFVTTSRASAMLVAITPDRMRSFRKAGSMCEEKSISVRAAVAFGELVGLPVD